MTRKVCDAAVKLIAQQEGLELDAYPDPATGDAPWTIGYGHTGPDVHPGLRITKDQALALLSADLDRFAGGVERLIGGTPTTDNQFGAMVSLAYNVGLGNFGRSTVLRDHNKQDYTGASMSFAMWNHANGRVFSGLTHRRILESQLYLTPDDKEPAFPSGNLDHPAPRKAPPNTTMPVRPQPQKGGDAPTTPVHKTQTWVDDAEDPSDTQADYLNRKELEG